LPPEPERLQSGTRMFGLSRSPVPRRKLNMGEEKELLPKFDLSEKTYETWRFELDCWVDTTSIEKKKLGTKILISLPEASKDPHKCRAHLNARLTKAELTAVDGHETF
jgi:hypothetical protein